MNLKSLKIYLLAVGLVVAGVLSACYVGANSTFYGFNAEKEFLYTQNKEWWTVGDGSNKNGSALAAFATVASHLNKTKITPAAVAKLAYEKGYWNLSGGIPTNLVDNLLKEYSNVKSVSSSGSNISQKISLVAQAFTKMENAAVVVRANGASPFNTSEAGGHYLAILAYRSDGQVHVYDPATEELSWYSAKSLFRKMTKNSMLYAISFSAGGDDLSVFTPSRTPQPVSEEEITIEVEDPAQPETEDDPESQDESPLILDFSIDEPTEPITEEKFDGSSVTILGDSMIARSNSDREYSEATSMSWYVKYYNGKVLSSLAGLKNALIDGTDGLTFSEGIAKIKNLKAANVRDNFVVDLGSNNCTSSVKGRCGEPAVTDTQVSELISAVRSKNKNARIFFVTNYVATESPKSKTDYSKLKEINRSVFEKAVSEN
ncbi:hypothetical protein IJG21_03055, partial [Candidatus Saccharibacteria bacterium]|nr:hypothetical protein [Candidatus Saccharibacteria bacterium]